MYGISPVCEANFSATAHRLYRRTQVVNDLSGVIPLDLLTVRGYRDISGEASWTQSIDPLVKASKTQELSDTSRRSSPNFESRSTRGFSIQGIAEVRISNQKIAISIQEKEDIAVCFSAGIRILEAYLDPADRPPHADLFLCRERLSIFLREHVPERKCL